jgi:hypothetical protein
MKITNEVIIEVLLATVREAYMEGRVSGICRVEQPWDESEAKKQVDDLRARFESNQSS